MFYTVKLLNTEEAVGGNRVRATYTVTDSCFVENVTLEYSRLANQNESVEPVAVLTAYMRRKRNVARNLAFYYVGMQEAPTYMAIDKNFIDRQFPSLNYGSTMYRLVELYYKDIKHIIDAYSENEEALIQALKEKINLKT